MVSSGCYVPAGLAGAGRVVLLYWAGVRSTDLCRVGSIFRVSLSFAALASLLYGHTAVLRQFLRITALQWLGYAVQSIRLPGCCSGIGRRRGRRLFALLCLWSPLFRILYCALCLLNCGVYLCLAALLAIERKQDP